MTWAGRSASIACGVAAVHPAGVSAEPSRIIKTIKRETGLTPETVRGFYRAASVAELLSSTAWRRTRVQVHQYSGPSPLHLTSTTS